MHGIWRPVIGSLFLVACFGKPKLPPTPAEEASGFGYVPLDGLAVAEYRDTASCLKSPAAAGKPAEWYASLPLLTALPDLSVRFAVASFSVDGALTFGPAKTTTSGSMYRAVLDYVNVDALPVNFLLQKWVVDSLGSIRARPMLAPLSAKERVDHYDAIIAPSQSAGGLSVQQLVKDTTGRNYQSVTIPIYVGIGMRLSADIRALKSNLTLTSLATIASEAQTNGLAGTLTVQTLGISGKSVATTLPLPSQLDQTTVENGILALGSSRAVIYGDTAGVTKTARVVGLYSPVGSDPRLINVIYSALARQRPEWRRSCLSID